MYLIRRTAKTQPGKAWEVAGYLTKICAAYSEGGRNKAQIYLKGPGLPGEPNVVYAEWIQERIEPTNPKSVPPAVLETSQKMLPLLTEYSIDFFDLATPEKLESRGLA